MTEQFWAQLAADMASILQRAHICQEWMKVYQPFLPPRVVIFFNAMIMNIAREMLLVSRVLKEEGLIV